MADDGNNSVSKTNDQTSDRNSSYYLHPSDYPRQMHVNDALNDNNYLDWIQEMENFLFVKNKIGFVDGTLKKQEKTDTVLRCDAMIKGWLTTAMEKEIRVSVKYANTVEEIWKDLCCGCGISKKPGELRDKERLYEFLLGLNSNFSTIRTQILAMKPIPTLGEAYHIVAEDEQQGVVSAGKKTNTETVAFQAFMRR
ncbi:uncharacterized protein LOC112521800 [Cynara cardunculus var. scolymus]|uniref:uncharacterized protein LOC112521800 n=1 Tax=Cynara cardunculus var. scolymus TaxID=59895 RepID=UPI000D626F35|nr:uncharacterized protein LOC112521800 [Cynara cardunculus var. scolymus]